MQNSISASHHYLLALAGIAYVIHSFWVWRPYQKRSVIDGSIAYVIS